MDDTTIHRTNGSVAAPESEAPPAVDVHTTIRRLAATIEGYVTTIRAMEDFVVLGINADHRGRVGVVHGFGREGTRMWRAADRVQRERFRKLQ